MKKLKCKATIKPVAFDMFRLDIHFYGNWYIQENFYSSKQSAIRSANAFAKKLNIELEWAK